MLTQCTEKYVSSIFYSSLDRNVDVPSEEPTKVQEEVRNKINHLTISLTFSRHISLDDEEDERCEQSTACQYWILWKSNLSLAPTTTKAFHVISSCSDQRKRDR